MRKEAVMPITGRTMTRRDVILGFLVVVCGLTLAARPPAVQAQLEEPQGKTSSSPPGQQWRGLHIMSVGHGGLPLLRRAIVEKLAPMGVNVLILEVNYNFKFASHPELSGGDLSIDDARDLAET